MSDLRPMAGRPGVPGIKCVVAATTTLAAKGGLWTLGFEIRLHQTKLYVWSNRSRFTKIDKKCLGSVLPTSYKCLSIDLNIFYSDEIYWAWH